MVLVATAIAKGVPLTVIAGGGLYSTHAPSTAVLVTKTSPLHTARDLEGKTVGVAALNDQATLALKKWLAANGADYKKVRMIELGYPEMIAGLTAGRIDAAMLAEPWQSAARNGGDRLYAKPFDSIAPEFNIGVWAATKSWAQAHPDLVRRFTGAIYAAAKWANSHHDESAQILAKYAKADPKMITPDTFDTSKFTNECLRIHGPWKFLRLIYQDTYEQLKESLGPNLNPKQILDLLEAADDDAPRCACGGRQSE